MNHSLVEINNQKPAQRQIFSPQIGDKAYAIITLHINLHIYFVELLIQSKSESYSKLP